MRHYFISLALLASPALARPTEQDLRSLRAPAGFKINIFAEADGARSLSAAGDGTVFVGTGGSSGKIKRVYAIRDTNNDGVADKTWIIADALNSPNGVAFYKGDLYVAEISRIIKYPNILSQLDKPPSPQVVYDKLPLERHHGWKYIAFGPDGKLYIPVGSPCNVCNTDEKPETRGKYMRLFRMNPDGTEFEEYAAGIRNTVGFAWHPRTKELWFSDNGRDMLGNDVPPDEINIAPKPGMHFGYPFVHGDDVKDPDFYAKMPKGLKITKPVVNLPAHIAPLGLEFYAGNQFPKEYQDRLFIAEHGSWNRDPIQGYRVTMVYLQKGKYQYESFVEGWLRPDHSSWGRPVDIATAKDGSLLISDDEGGIIYRVSYGK